VFAETELAVWVHIEDTGRLGIGFPRCWGDDHLPAGRCGIAADGDAECDLQTESLPNPKADECQDDAGRSIQGNDDSRCSRRVGENSLAGFHHNID
jgi:hypothetical protein